MSRETLSNMKVRQNFIMTIRGLTSLRKKKRKKIKIKNKAMQIQIQKQKRLKKVKVRVKRKLKWIKLDNLKKIKIHQGRA